MQKGQKQFDDVSALLEVLKNKGNQNQNKRSWKGCRNHKNKPDGMGY